MNLKKNLPVLAHPKFVLKSVFSGNGIRVSSHDKIDFSNLAIGVLVINIILAVGFRFLNLTSFSFWGGEIFIIDGIRQSWTEMFRYIIQDVVHPPLVYVLLKWWLLIGGESLLWLKLFAVIFGIAAIIPLFLLCRVLNLGPGETNLVLFLFGVNGFLVHYAQEVRNYGMLLFLSLLALWLFINFINNEGSSLKSYVWLSIVNLLLVYTHYFGWIVLALQFGTLLFWRRQKLTWLLGSAAIIVLSYLPWLLFVSMAASNKGGLDSNLDWIPRPNLQAVGNLLADFNGAFDSRQSKIAAILLLLFPVITLALQVIFNLSREKSYDKVFVWLAFVVFSPIIVVFIGSQYMTQSYFIDRYLIFVAPLCMMLIAISVFRLHPRWLRNTSIVAIVLWAGIAGLSNAITNQVAWTNPQVGSRVRWGQLADQLTRIEVRSQNPIKIYTISTRAENRLTGDWAIETSLNFQFDMMQEEIFDIEYVGKPELLTSKIETDHFWVGFFKLGDFNPENEVVQVLTDNGFRIGTPIRQTYQKNQIIFLPAERNN